MTNSDGVGGGKMCEFLNNLAFIKIMEHFFLKYNKASWQAFLAYVLFVEKCLLVIQEARNIYCSGTTSVI